MFTEIFATQKIMQNFAELGLGLEGIVGTYTLRGGYTPDASLRACGAQLVTFPTLPLVQKRHWSKNVTSLTGGPN